MASKGTTTLGSCGYYLALLALSFFLLASSAHAGKVYNQSPWPGLYTTNASPNDNCRSCCYFWNWQNSSPQGKMCSCTQKILAKNRATGSDVDGFTYAERDYYWSGKWVKRGQWTKLSNSQTARCVSKGGVPHCCKTGDPESAGCCWGASPGDNGIIC